MQATVDLKMIKYESHFEMWKNEVVIALHDGATQL